jgi:hypothetical protein
MSHEYDFLAHAILGLAAQHLSASTASDFSVPALSHRVSAITSLNSALSAPCTTKEDADAKFAAAILLTFQSSYMPDGMMEFLSMMRGWMIIQTTVVPSMGESIFRGITEDMYVGSMRKLLGPAANSDSRAGEELQHTMEDFMASLRLLAPLCQSPAELHYLASMERIARLSETSPVNGMYFQPLRAVMVKNVAVLTIPQLASSSSPFMPRRTTWTPMSLPALPARPTSPHRSCWSTSGC